MIKPIRYSISDPIYGFLWVACYGGSLPQEINKLCEEIKVEYRSDRQDDQQVHGFFFSHPPIKTSLLWFPDKYPAAATVSHECLHATMYMFSLMSGFGPDDKSEEHFAYYLAWLVHNVYRVRK